MDKIIKDIQDALGGDADKVKEFFANPKEALEKHGIEFDKEHLEDIVSSVKEKVNFGDIAEKGEEIVEGLAEKGEELFEGVKGLFKK